MNEVSIKGGKTERRRSDSLMQPLHECSRGERSRGAERMRSLEGAALHISVKVSEHQLPAQLCISTQGLLFFLFVAATRFTVICSGCSSLQDVDVGRDVRMLGVYHLKDEWLSHRRSFASFKIIDRICYQCCFKTVGKAERTSLEVSVGVWRYWLDLVLILDEITFWSSSE